MDYAIRRASLVAEGFMHPAHLSWRFRWSRLGWRLALYVLLARLAMITTTQLVRMWDALPAIHGHVKCQEIQTALEAAGVTVIQPSPSSAGVEEAGDVPTRNDEMAWIATHQDELSAIPPGDWIAIDGSALVAHGPVLKDVLQESADRGHPDPLVTAIPTFTGPFFGEASSAGALTLSRDAWALVLDILQHVEPEYECRTLEEVRARIAGWLEAGA